MQPRDDRQQSDPGAVLDEIEEGAVQVSQPHPGVAILQIASEPLGVLRHGVKGAIEAALESLATDGHTAVVILTGTGRAFSVGSDIRTFRQDAGWQKWAQWRDQRLNYAIESSPLVVIAACNGYTLGGGAELALACDLRVAAQSARFGFPEVQVGAFASAGGTQRLPQHVGAGRALELLLTGRTISADDAFRFGLVQEVVADAELVARALQLAEELAALPREALAATKLCVQSGLRYGRLAGHLSEDEHVVEVALGADAAEGQRAFLEKRAPDYQSSSHGRPPND